MLDLKLELYKSEASNLWYKVYTQLLPSENNFKSKVQAWFTNFQKDINKELKSTDKPDFEKVYSKYIEKFVKIYVEHSKKIISFAKDRAEKEALKVIEEDLFNKVLENYTLEYIESSARLVVFTTKKHINDEINKFNNGDITKEELKDNINEYFNKHKGNRSKLIATTETYRAYNFAYLNFMAYFGYLYKIYIARPDTTCPVCKHLHLQKKFILSNFDVSTIDTKNILIENLRFPPVHIQSRSIILCTKE